MDFLIWKYWDKNTLWNEKIIIFYTQSRRKKLSFKKKLQKTETRTSRMNDKKLNWL